jgi:hypothetical protein
MLDEVDLVVLVQPAYRRRSSVVPCRWVIRELQRLSSL